VVQRQLEDELGCGRNTEIASGKRRHHVQMLFNRLKNRVGIQVHIVHHLGKHVPFDLGEGQEQVLVRQERMLAAASLLDSPVDDALRRLGDLAW